MNKGQENCTDTVGEAMHGVAGFGEALEVFYRAPTEESHRALELVAEAKPGLGTALDSLLGEPKPEKPPSFQRPSSYRTYDGSFVPYETDLMHHKPQGVL